MGLGAARYALWDATDWRRDYTPPAWRSRANEEQKKRGWKMAVRIEKINCTVLDNPAVDRSRKRCTLSPRDRRD
ncbi:MAG: hypothetical protein AVDCRST_MAG78-44 [uncultured Rubrobacteraceae bacterium]|uniref:Uncharacterized protein n=1 Tax=uncultured Rubrobacteraceae bacterium TaxID=349277 RepID=A0A6J4PAF5_9ACTN|nr:MAG: hypothetical protein AVDCRST_MAG78-44 [uncultured Rubrobacteraceae bacterium]